MSDISCPFCSVKYPASELIAHCRLCRQKKQQQKQQVNVPIEPKRSDSPPSVVQNTDEEKPKQRVTIVNDPELETPPERKTKPKTLPNIQAPVEKDESELRPKMELKRSPPQTRKAVVRQPESPSQPAEAESDENAVNRVECELCGRLFNEDRIEKHMVACRINQRPRKQFDATEKRFEGLDPKDKQLINEQPKVTNNIKDQLKTPKVKATKLNWDITDTTEYDEGTKKTAFKPEYDETEAQKKVRLEQEKKKADAEKAKLQDTEKAKSPDKSDQQKIEPKPEIKIIGSKEDEEEPEPEVKTEQKQNKTPKPKEAKKRKSSDKTNQLQQLQMMLANIQQQPAQFNPVYQQPPVQQPPQQQYPQYQPVYQQQMPPRQQTYAPPQNVPPPIYAQKPFRTRFCIHCGNPYHENAGFCGYCGAQRVE